MANYAIGDIQGCFDELMNLLHKIKFKTDRDQLWICGDLINRGPKSLESIEFLYSIRENCFITLGNHDLHFLAIAEKVIEISDSDTFQEILENRNLHIYLNWIKELPFYHIGKIKNNGKTRSYVMTHAGIPPHWTIEDLKKYSQELYETLQGPEALNLLKNMYGNEPNHPSKCVTEMERLRLNINYLTRMRFCSRDGSLDLKHKGKATDAPSGTKPWFEWNLKILQDPIHLLFGHWAALEGVTGKKNITALDTGCVWGKKLSALRLEDNRIFSCNKIN
jgi:bis(5'-nucleosyl)-tetraphosphatase (symmetrical)